MEKMNLDKSLEEIIIYARKFKEVRSSQYSITYKTEKGDEISKRYLLEFSFFNADSNYRKYQKKRDEIMEAFEQLGWEGTKPFLHEGNSYFILTPPAEFEVNDVKKIFNQFFTKSEV